MPLVGWLENTSDDFDHISTFHKKISDLINSYGDLTKLSILPLLSGRKFYLLNYKCSYNLRYIILINVIIIITTGMVINYVPDRPAVPTHKNQLILLERGVEQW